MTAIKDIFKTDVTRTISPVIYFHEDSPEKLAQEVSEYIITGGDGDGKTDGIHEQYVRLLKGIHHELTEGGKELPACWISGFYGSGKSSFAKLLGLALDGRTLPDGTPLSQAWLARDESPKQAELRAAWETLTRDLNSLAVVFDIGAVARDGETVQSAMKKMLARRLGYCDHKNQSIAEYELLLEKDGHYDEFLKVYQQEFGRSWEESKTRGLIEDEFSLVMHRLFPDRYESPLDWADAKSGSSAHSGSSAEETVQTVADMLAQRAPGATLFFVIDEVSQYIHGESKRMLALQSLISALGQRMKGKVWLLATGQQKLDDETEGSELPKLKGRFPHHLRAHLSPANIRDVVHRRLLKKRPESEGALRQLFADHGTKLRLNAFGGEHIKEADFLEIYPMLPGQVDLLMRISSNLRVRSSRMKGDDQGIRSLLQLLGELFREKQLGELPLGHLVTIDHIYDVQATTLDADIQNTMARLLADPEVKADPWATRVAKSVALLEVVSEVYPTDDTMIAKCLYSRLGEDNPTPHVQQALGKLVEANFLTPAGKGYKILSSAGQEWARRREGLPVASQAICDEVKDVLKRLLGRVDRPKLKGLPFALAATFTDGKAHNQDRLVSPSDQSAIAFEFAFFRGKDGLDPATWINRSTESTRSSTIVWVNGEAELLRATIKALIQSRQMVNQNAPRRNTLSDGERGCLNNEEQLKEQLGQKVEDMVAQAYLEGALYFRGKTLDHHKFSGGFSAVVGKVSEEILPQLYQHFVELSISDGEREQLFSPQLSSISKKFYSEGLGILEIDSGKAVVSCQGEVPRRVLEFIKEEKGVTGAELFKAMGGPPYGYYADLLQATVLGLLRGEKVKIQTAKGPITSYKDPGCQELFKKPQELKRATIVQADPPKIGPRQRNKFLRFFEETFNATLADENEVIVDALYLYFPQLNAELTAFFHKLKKLAPVQIKLPASLEKLPELLEKCRVDRAVQETLLHLDKHVDAISDGVSYLRRYNKMLFDDAISAINEAQQVHQFCWLQMEDFGCDDQLAALGAQLETLLQAEKPWDDTAGLKASAARVRQAYIEIRQGLLTRQAEMFQAERQRFRSLDGVAKLTPEKVEMVMRPFYQQELPMDVNATAPDLITLRDQPQPRLARATELATQALDQALSEEEGAQTLPFELNLSGKVIASVDDVDALLATLRRRLLDQLKENKVKVRLK